MDNEYIQGSGCFMNESTNKTTDYIRNNRNGFIMNYNGFVHENTMNENKSRCAYCGAIIDFSSDKIMNCCDGTGRMFFADKF